MIPQVIGAAAGAMAANLVLEKFIIKQTDDGPGFIRAADGFGVDDVVRWALIGVGAVMGAKLGGKFGGGL